MRTAIAQRSVEVARGRLHTRAPATRNAIRERDVLTSYLPQHRITCCNAARHATYPPHWRRRFPRLARLDISKARRVLGWEPRVFVDDGLAGTIDYYRDRQIKARSAVA